MDKESLRKHISHVLDAAGENVSPTAIELIKNLSDSIDDTDELKHREIELATEAAVILVDEASIGSAPAVAKIMSGFVLNGMIDEETAIKSVRPETAALIPGLIRTTQLYRKQLSTESDNFRKLLLSVANDIRIIIVMICEVLYMVRNYEKTDEEKAKKVARESRVIFAPLAHRLGLYKIKSELEDTSMKILWYDTYKEIATKLQQTKDVRDKYIDAFITPLKKKLEDNGLKFHIKGRTKSINSIWNKIQQSNTPFERIYDLFAIRIIIDCPLEEEKSECWKVYSLITDQYQPNPRRLRDWISIPKSNGYESLHTTVMGPEGKWVEVQIRTERMDEVAEKGFAAHFKYKGIKGENTLDQYMAGVREILENTDNVSTSPEMSEFKMNLYEDDVFVFTPKGDLFHLPLGATVLDFAYLIHSSVGNKCTGGRIDDKIVSLREKLNQGDQVEILTSTTQKPKEEWLKFCITSKAKNRIKAFLREQDNSEAMMAKEMLVRRFKNWRIELEESVLGKVIKKLGYKMATDFYRDLGTETLDIQKVKDTYEHQKAIDSGLVTEQAKSADTFRHHSELEDKSAIDDILTIDRGLKGIQYTLSPCCLPIYGDDIFGFILTSGGIKIHRADCPNAADLKQRYPYRCISARWSGGEDGGKSYATMKVIGNDDIGIMAGVSSVLSHEQNIKVRGMRVDSEAGLFICYVSLSLLGITKTDGIIKKVKEIPGVKNAVFEHIR